MSLQRNPRIDSSNILQRTSMANKTTFAMLEQYPECNELLPIMYQAHIFTDTLHRNKTIFADLLHVLKDIRYGKNKENKVKEDDINSLLNLYKLLSGALNEPFLLNASIHHKIIHDVAPADKLTLSNKLLSKLQPLTPAITDKLFAQPLVYLALYHYTSEFDPTPDSFFYIFNKTADAESVKELQEFLSLFHIMNKETWVTPQIFKMIVDNTIDHPQCIYDVVNCLHTLQRVSLVETHFEFFMQHPDQAKSLHELKMREILTKESVLWSIENPNFASAIDLCNRLDVPGDNLNDDVKLALLKNPRLSKAIDELSNIMTLYQEKNGDYSKKTFKKDLEAIFNSQKVLEDKTSTVKLFSSNVQTLDDCLQAIKEKYSVPQMKNSRPS